MYWFLSPIIAAGALIIGFPLTKLLAKLGIIELPIVRYIPTFIGDIVAVYFAALCFLIIIYRASETSFVDFNKFTFRGVIAGFIVNLSLSLPTTMAIGIVMLPIIAFQLLGVLLAFKTVNYVVKN